jgi:undecaprenyl-diphosphatase
LELVAAALLGVIQGLTEFLPVSSSGHLILARAVTGWDPGRFGLAFDVACHAGTLLSVAWFFRAEIVSLTVAAPRALLGYRGTWEHLGRLIVAGTVPVGLVGLLFADLVSGPLRSPEVVVGTMAAGAVGLSLAEWWGTGRREAATLGYGEAVLIGVAQAAALVPGVSRSGATLTVAMLLGLTRESAARFVFLLGLPAITAAAVKEAVDVAGAPEAGAVPVDLLLTGMGVSALVGYVTVKYFLRYLVGHTLHGFAVYRLLLAAGTLLWLVRG